MTDHDQPCPICDERLTGRAEVGAGDDGVVVYSCSGECGRFVVSAANAPLLASLDKWGKRRLASLLSMWAADSSEPMELTQELIEG